MERNGSKNSLFAGDCVSCFVWDDALSSIPEGCSVAISLNLEEQSSLDWEKEKKRASALSEKGISLVWDLEMGLFKAPFIDVAPLLFALEHFKQEILALFEEQTQGCIFYKGALNAHFSQTLLETLLAPLNENLKAYLLFEKIGPEHFRTLSCIEHFHLALTEYAFAFDAAVWEGKGVYTSSAQEIKRGVVLPALVEWDKVEMPFKVIGEEQLTQKWDGLDSLIVQAEALSPQGKRKIAGFKAAGGTLIAAETL